MEVKVCGITNIEDAAAAVECGADALGFIFHAPSPRYVSPEQAKNIIESLSGKPVCKVGVFVNRNWRIIKEIAAFCGFDLIQLHGDEKPRFCAKFPGESLIKAVSPESAKDLPELELYVVRAFLFDTRKGGLYGGTGKTCDWELASNLARQRPLILAGGLGPDNVQEAIRKVAPSAVDLNSGIESEPGKKDYVKMGKTVEIAKRTVLKRIGNSIFKKG